jgi:hypothetical protein
MPINMKKHTIITAFLAIFISINLNARDVNNLSSNTQTTYFIINPETSEYKVNTVVLETKRLYDYAPPIELFNLQSDEKSLILFSVLPSNSISGNWTEIDLKGLKNIIDYAALKKKTEQRFKTFLDSGRKNADELKRDDIKLIIKKNGKYLVSNYCVTEYFVIINQAMMFPNQMGNIFINIQSPPLTVQSFENHYKELYHDYSANAIISANATGSSFLLPPFQQPLLFLSGIMKVNEKKAYRFWQLSDWRIADGLNFRRGIDRFLYQPEVGIVGGSFDFWFKKSISQDILFKNYLSEELLYPISINGAKVTTAL